MDLDTGGIPEHFELAVSKLDKIGVSAVIIEDKTGLKKNSLFGNDVVQNQTLLKFVKNFKRNKAKLGRIL